MRRRRNQVAAVATRRGGLALPTALAAAVCGGSVLAIAISGTVALDGGSVAVEVLAPEPADPVATRTPPSAARPSRASAVPPAAALRPTAPRPPAGSVLADPSVASRRVPSAARTASEYPVRLGAAASGPGAAAGPLIPPKPASLPTPQADPPAPTAPTSPAVPDSPATPAVPSAPGPGPGGLPTAGPPEPEAGRGMVVAAVSGTLGGRPGEPAGVADQVGGADQAGGTGDDSGAFRAPIREAAAVTAVPRKIVKRAKGRRSGR